LTSLVQVRVTLRVKVKVMVRVRIMVRVWVRRRIRFFLTILVQGDLLNTIVPDGDSDEEWNLRFQNGFNRVRKWTSQSNILNKKCLFIPVNLNDHWSLIIVYDHIGYLVMSSLVMS